MGQHGWTLIKKGVIAKRMSMKKQYTHSNWKERSINMTMYLKQWQLINWMKLHSWIIGFIKYNELFDLLHITMMNFAIYRFQLYPVMNNLINQYNEIFNLLHITVMSFAILGLQLSIHHVCVSVCVWYHCSRIDKYCMAWRIDYIHSV